MGPLHGSLAFVLALTACASQTPDERVQEAIAAQPQDHTRERMQAITDAENKALAERLGTGGGSRPAPPTLVPAASAAPPPPAPVDDEVGVGGLPPIKRVFVFAPEKCASLTPEKVKNLITTILSAPQTPGDSYKDDPLPKLREESNGLRGLVAAARQCVQPIDAWRIIFPNGTWIGGTPTRRDGRRGSMRRSIGPRRASSSPGAWQRAPPPT
jgi:hypothetical protein